MAIPRTTPQNRSPQNMDQLVATLKEHFTQYRQSSPRSKGQKIPTTLRRLALEAIDQGVPVSKVQCVCHVSAHQIDGWRAQLQTPEDKGDAVSTAMDSETSLANPRVFSVLPEDTCNENLSPEGRHQGFQLELRMGPWRLQLALNEQGGLTLGGGA